MSQVDKTTCHTVHIVLRIITFFSVLLNPIVYATTQRDIRNYIRNKIVARATKRWPFNWRRKAGGGGGANKTAAAANRQQQQQQQPKNNGAAATAAVVTTDRKVAVVAAEGKPRKDDKHKRHRERRMWLAQRLGRHRGQHQQLSVSEKPSDGTIDEEAAVVAAVADGPAAAQTL